jgi:hypothetical protein
MIHQRGITTFTMPKTHNNKSVVIETISNSHSTCNTTPHQDHESHPEAEEVEVEVEATEVEDHTHCHQDSSLHSHPCWQHNNLWTSLSAICHRHLWEIGPKQRVF